MRLVIFITGLASLVLLFLFSAYLVQQRKQSVVENNTTPTDTPRVASAQTALVETVATSYRNPFDTIITQEASTSGDIEYPISQLGNCQSAQQCYTYCLVPKNTPACWSYGTFVLNKQVLGVSTSTSNDEEKVVSCDADESCKSYCQKDPDRCPGYSATEKNYLGSSGCRTETECQTFCEDHPSLCPGFQSSQSTNSPAIPSPTPLSDQQQYQQ